MINEINQLVKTSITDPQRLHFHLQPPVGLLNDPNGLIQHQGEYHVFYQWNPFGCQHQNKVWGHVTTKNFVEFTQKPVALTPTDWYDKNGCYSGSAFVKDDQIHLLYTGNVKDEQGQRQSYQCLARVTAADQVEKLGVVIDDNEIPAGYTKHFRDPKVWYHEEKQRWFAIIGAQTVAEKGTALLFSSVDAKTWAFQGELQTDYTQKFGYMWECPDLFALEGQDVLLFSPQGLTPTGMDYANIYQSGYLVGTFNPETLVMEHGKFYEIDRGFEFYAPQTFVDEQGRTIMLAWMGLPEEEEQPTCEHGWVHALSLPRVLSLQAGRIYQQPLPELQQLRVQSEHQHLEQRQLTSEMLSVGETYELQLTFSALKATGNLRLQFGQHHELAIDCATQVVTLTRGGDYLPGMRQCQLDFSEQLRLTIFKDTSSVEIFLENGQQVFTARTFHDVDPTLTLMSDQAVAMSGDYWPLQALTWK